MALGTLSAWRFPGKTNVRTNLFGQMDWMEFFGKFTIFPHRSIRITGKWLVHYVASIKCHTVFETSSPQITFSTMFSKIKCAVRDILSKLFPVFSGNYKK